MLAYQLSLLSYPVLDRLAPYCLLTLSHGRLSTYLRGADLEFDWGSSPRVPEPHSGRRGPGEGISNMITPCPTEHLATASRHGGSVKYLGMYHPVVVKVV